MNELISFIGIILKLSSYCEFQMKNSESFPQYKKFPSVRFLSSKNEGQFYTAPLPTPPTTNVIELLLFECVFDRLKRVVQLLRQFWQT